MFGSPYKFNFLGTSQRFGSKNLVSQSKYRFVAKHRKYFVVADHFDFNLIGIKYCDNKDRDSRNAYTKIFNEKDSDASRVIATCISIMHSLWRENPFISFGFYATPRTMDINTIVSTKKFKDEAALNNYVERQKRTRFLIYEHAMINLFSPKNFFKLKDYDNSLYILLNKEIAKGKTYRKKEYQVKVEEIGKYLLNNHDIIFEPTEHLDEQRPQRDDITIG
jgi:hypothetical protein